MHKTSCSAAKAWPVWSGGAKLAGMRSKLMFVLGFFAELSSAPALRQMMKPLHLYNVRLQGAVRRQ
jgi:hypothetical protein